MAVVTHTREGEDKPVSSLAAVVALNNWVDLQREAARHRATRCAPCAEGGCLTRMVQERRAATRKAAERAQRMMAGPRPLC